MKPGISKEKITVNAYDNRASEENIIETIEIPLETERQPNLAIITEYWKYPRKRIRIKERTVKAE